MGTLVIISSPSGGGKDSVINALLQRFPTAIRLLTTTSRPMRPGNREGVDYHFVSENEFKQMIASGEFIEHNFYAGNYYGSERARVESTLASHPIAFTQIEVNGKHSIDKTNIPHLSIFLLPESLEILKNRIEKRGGITPELIAERLAIAEKEIAESEDYDYKIVNYEGKFEETVDKIAQILTERLAIDKKG